MVQADSGHRGLESRSTQVIAIAERSLNLSGVMPTPCQMLRHIMTHWRNRQWVFVSRDYEK